jgi:hypothetical protein
VSIKKRIMLIPAIVWLVCLPIALGRIDAQGTQKPFADALTFHASFDNGPDADFALGDRRIHTATSYKRLEDAKPGLHNPQVTVLPGQGKYGGTLEFKAKNTNAIYFQAEKNIDYKPAGWNGTVSFWLSLNPNEELTGFSDPIQITDKDYNDAAMWVDFTNDKPRHFRLGVFGNLSAWNPNAVRGQTNPEFLRHIVAVTTPPFARGTWTHVAITFSGINSQPPGAASLYLNGKLQGSTQPITEPFTWDIARAKLRVGVNYVGLLDEVSVFNRALTDGEVQTLYGLAKGVSELRR